jgi:micrococcal nuclease
MRIEELNDAPWFTLDDEQLQCKIIDVYDGDTITIIFPFSDGYYKDKCRLYGIDTPEVRTKNAEEKAAGIKARDWLKEKILNKTMLIEFKGKDKYGRLMGVIYENINSTSINMQLVANGMAYEYEGGKKKPFDSW